MFYFRNQHSRYISKLRSKYFVSNEFIIENRKFIKRKHQVKLRLLTTVHLMSYDAFVLTCRFAVPLGERRLQFHG